VLSEIYGGGGNSGARYKQDFVELFNPTPDPVVMNNWSVQYASSGGAFTAGNRTILSGTIQPYSYFLVQEAQGSAGTDDLPAPDITGSVALSGTNGKIALVSDTLLIAGPSDAGVVDFVGYGTANQFEGSGPASALGNTISGERKAIAASTDTTMAPGGIDGLKGNAFDANDNATDIVRRRDQEPQNSLSAPEIPPGAQTTLVCSLAERWNLVAVPLRMHSWEPDAIFPGRTSAVYAYDGGYYETDSLRNGSGYWLKFATDTSITMTGILRTRDTVLLHAGWNMIGALSLPVAVADIQQDPPGVISSPFYHYGNGYLQSDTLTTGRGYWIKAGSAGSLIFSRPASFDHTRFIIR
jgi:hypothetical protein